MLNSTGTEVNVLSQGECGGRREVGRVGAQLSTAPMHVGAGDEAVSQVGGVGITASCASSNDGATLRRDRPNHSFKQPNPLKTGNGKEL